MKKTIAAVTIGLALVAGQAAAAGQANARVGDRLGAPAGASSEFRGAVAPTILFTAALIALVVIGSDDDSTSN